MGVVSVGIDSSQQWNHSIRRGWLYFDKFGFIFNLFPKYPSMAAVGVRRILFPI